MTLNNKQRTFIFTRNWSCSPLQLSKDDFLNNYITFRIRFLEMTKDRKPLQSGKRKKKSKPFKFFFLFCCLIEQNHKCQIVVFQVCSKTCPLLRWRGEKTEFLTEHFFPLSPHLIFKYILINLSYIEGLLLFYLILPGNAEDFVFIFRVNWVVKGK